MSKKIEERKSTAFNKIVQLNNKIIYSGECEFSFDVKVLGITRFNNVLKHNEQPRIFS